MGSSYPPKFAEGDVVKMELNKAEGTFKVRERATCRNAMRDSQSLSDTCAVPAMLRHT